MAGIADVARKAGIDTKGVKDVLDAIKGIADSGERVVIQGFGTFEVKTRAARKGRNPQTGGEIDIPAKSVLAFRPAKS